MQIRIIRTRQYSARQVTKLREALSIFQNSINSPDFQQMILNHPAFETDAGLSNSRIYDIIMSGREMRSQPDNTADFDLTLDFRNSTDRVGYTMNTSIFTFANMFDANSTVFLAGHFAHEYCHTLGFKDPDDLSDTSRNVPYQVGGIISYIASGNNLNVKRINTRNRKIAGRQPIKKTTPLKKPKKRVVKKKLVKKGRK